MIRTHTVAVIEEPMQNRGAICIRVFKGNLTDVIDRLPSPKHTRHVFEVDGCNTGNEAIAKTVDFIVAVSAVPSGVRKIK